MMNDERGTMNDEVRACLSFIVHRSYFIVLSSSFPRLLLRLGGGFSFLFRVAVGFPHGLILLVFSLAVLLLPVFV
jgi:hypothetical protein